MNQLANPSVSGRHFLWSVPSRGTQNSMRENKVRLVWPRVIILVMLEDLSGLTEVQTGCQEKVLH